MEEYKYLVPEESMDVMVDVSSLREIEGHLRDVFQSHHYSEVLLPSFEYVDLYKDMDVGIETENMFQYINYAGKWVALRADFTVPLARLYSTQKAQGVKRYCYFGNVFRKEKKHKGRSSEFFQAGVELIGEAGIQGDIECLRIIQETLQYLKIKDIKIELSSAKFYHRICQLVNDDSFVKILKKRDISGMERLVEKNSTLLPLKELLIKLPECFGNIDMLDEMIELIQDIELKECLLELKGLYEKLEMKECFSFDLAMTPSMKYYTGIMIKGYTLNSAKPIINGGRYDQLMSHFQKDVPAIGFSYDLSHIIEALEKEEEDND